MELTKRDARNRRGAIEVDNYIMSGVAHATILDCTCARPMSCPIAKMSSRLYLTAARTPDPEAS
jgi:hypothetical protein